MRERDTGILLIEKNIKLHRMYFKQMVDLLGINVIYRAPKEGTKEYNQYAELDAQYQCPEVVGCIYDEHPTQKTMRKLGWNSELADSSVVIHVPYDLHDLQAGALFILPAGIDDAKGRVYRVLRMSTIAVYPASIPCELGPLMVNTLPPDKITDFKDSNFNLLDDDEHEGIAPPTIDYNLLNGED